MISRTQYYKDILTKNICTVAFEKADGTTRIMNCTLLKDVLRHFNLLPVSPADVQNDTNVNVVDVEIGEWRSFRVDRIKSFKILSGSIGDLSPHLSRPAASQYAQMQNVPPAPVATHIMYAYNPDPSTTTRDFYIAALKDGVCEISFVKADGTERVMRGTLAPYYIQLYGLNTTDKSPQAIDDGDTIRLVDIDVQGWRSFKVSRVQSFKTATVPQEPEVIHTPVKRTKLGMIPA